jgi:MarR-like DNA-binding transcriptional regulator SgrR of sgrS sRNA
MFRLLNHVEDKLQALLEFLCPNPILLESKVPKENILVKDELFSRMKEERIHLFNKRKEETKELQNKLKKYPILHIKMKEESIGLLKIDENTIVATLALGS